MPDPATSTTPPPSASTGVTPASSAPGTSSSATSTSAATPPPATTMPPATPPSTATTTATSTATTPPTTPPSAATPAIDTSSSLALVQTPADKTTNSQDQQFLQQAQLANLTEIAEAKVALTNGASAATTEYAHWMLGDHSALGAGMTSLVSALGLTPTTTLDGTHQSEVQALASQSGSAFDKAYGTQEVQDHTATVQLFQQEAANTGGNAALVSLAKEALPLLQAHEAAANKLSGSGAAASSGSGATASSQPAAVAAPAGTTPGSPPQPLSQQDQAFLQAAGSANQAELAEAKLVLGQSTDPASQVYANWMTADHTAMTSTLTQIAQQQGAQVPTALSSSAQSELSKLQPLQGAALTSAYASDAVVDHGSTLIQFIAEATAGQNAALKAYAAASVPVLAEHLKGAIDLQLNAAGITPAGQAPGSGQGAGQGTWTLADLISHATSASGSGGGNNAGASGSGTGTGAGSTTMADLSAPPPAGGSSGASTTPAGGTANDNTTTPPAGGAAFTDQSQQTQMQGLLAPGG